MQTIGERLEEARKRKGISIREAAEATKIRSEYLHKMEGNSFDLSLPDIYVRGFLHNYAAYLKLNPDKLLADYRTLVPAEGRAARRENRENYGRMDLAQAPTPAPEAAPGPAPEAEAPAPAPVPVRHSFATTGGGGAPAIDPALLIKGGIAIVLGLLLVVAIILGIRARDVGNPRRGRADDHADRPRLGPDQARPGARRGRDLPGHPDQGRDPHLSQTRLAPADRDGAAER